jgi:hypothetical protein
VDAGVLGIFDQEAFAGREYRDEDISDQIMTDAPIEGGVYCNSGVGDGGYPFYVAKNEKGEAIAGIALFLSSGDPTFATETEEDEDGFRDYIEPQNPDPVDLDHIRAALDALAVATAFR